LIGRRAASNEASKTHSFFYLSTFNIIAMSHVFARLRGIQLDDLEMVLMADAAEHAERGMNLEFLWRNADDAEEVLFLFSAEDLDKARAYINEMLGQAMSAFPDLPTPSITYLQN